MIQYDKYAEEQANGFNTDWNDNDSLAHTGPGKPGRSKGSKNGQIDPNAVAMKYYHVVGKKAEGEEDPTQPATPAQTARPATYGSRSGPAPRQQVQSTPRTQNVQQTTQRTAVASKPQSSVQTGKTIMENILRGQTSGGAADKNLNWLRTNQDYPDISDEQFNRYLENTSNATNQSFVGKAENGPVAPKQEQAKSGLSMTPKQAISSEVRPTLVGQAAEVADTVKAKAQEVGKTVATTAGNVAGAVKSGADTVAKTADQAWNGRTIDAGEREPISGNYEPASQEMHEKGIRENIEETLVNAGDQAKAWWEDLLDWGESAWNDTKNWATSAIDTGSRAFNDAKTWIGDRFNDAGSWAQTAYKDVSNWMGDRGAELDRWWNGYDEKKVYGKPENRAERQESHVNGFRENAANWIDQAGKDIGNWAQQNIANPVNDAYKNASQWVTDRADDVANAADRLWNGYETEKTYGSPEDRERRQASHVNGLRENIEQAAGGAVDTVRNAIGEASDNVVRTVRDAAGNVHQAVVDAAGNIVGWVGERAEDVDTWWNGYETEKTYGSPADRERRQESHVNGFRENAVNAVNNAAEQIRQAVDDAGTAIRDLPENAGNWVQQNVTNPVTGAIETYLVNPVTGAYQKVSDAIQSVANTAVGMARNAGMAVQPAVDWMDRNVVQPVAGFVSSRANAAQMNGDNLSTKALNSGYSMPAVNYITQMAVNGDISTGEREQLMNAMNLAANKDQGQRAAYYLGQLSRGAIDFNEAMSKIEDLSKQNRGQNNR